MSAFDALFIALVIGGFASRSKRWWLASAGPLIAVSIHLVPLGIYKIPILALLMVVLCVNSSRAALLFAVPVYEDLAHALFISVLWLTLVLLLDSLNPRLQDESISVRWRGSPIRLVVVGLLYYTFLPLSYL